LREVRELYFGVGGVFEFLVFGDEGKGRGGKGREGEGRKWGWGA